MQKHIGTLVVTALALGLAADAHAQIGQIQGFGGMTLRGLSPSATMGGSLAVSLTDNIQVVAEGGRIADLTTAPLAEWIALTPFDARVSATYGQAGLRIIGSPHRVARPYGEVTAGLARLHTGVAGFNGSGLVNTALGFLDSTQPILGLGAGVVLQGGPLVVDLGYRYHQIRTGGIVQTALTGGSLDAQEVRFGLGFRF